MSEIILHHYPVSHFSEKIRRVLAYKRIPWRSVQQPMMMPKPDLVPLTGGYRRIPVLQIGADVYCDTACIARRLEQLYPDPPCIPAHLSGLVTAVEDWADKRFSPQMLLPAFVALIPMLPADVMDDRSKMAPGLTKENFIAGAPHAMRQAQVSMQQLESMLGRHDYLLGDQFTLADAACYFTLWLMRNSPELYDAATAPYPALRAWFARVEAFGPGDSLPMSTQEALSIARDAQPADIAAGAGFTAVGTAPAIAAGSHVSVIADDYGQEVVSGKLLRVADETFTLLREGTNLGDIAVHFPRIGYRVEAG